MTERIRSTTNNTSSSNTSTSMTIAAVGGSGAAPVTKKSPRSGPARVEPWVGSGGGGCQGGTCSSTDDDDDDDDGKKKKLLRSSLLPRRPSGATAAWSSPAAATATENRYAAIMFLAITVTACVLLSYRDTPLHSARIPSSRTISQRQHHEHQPYHHDHNPNDDGDDGDGQQQAIPSTRTNSHEDDYNQRKNNDQLLPGIRSTSSLQKDQQSPPRSSQSSPPPRLQSRSMDIWDPIPCEVMIGRLTKSPTGIQLVALDFDKTIVDIHTGGRWKQSYKKLADYHVRPNFQCLIDHCLRVGVRVAVTTFSKQKDLIQSVLYRSLLQPYKQQQQVPPSYFDDFQPESIPVFGGDDWIKGHTVGKQSQLLLAIQYFNEQQQQKLDDAATTTTTNDNKDDPSNKRRIKITAQSTLLIDDDSRNIRTAQQDGYQTILYPEEEEEEESESESEEERHYGRGHRRRHGRRPPPREHEQHERHHKHHHHDRDRERRR